MELILNYILFLFEVATIVVAILFVFAGVFKGKKEQKGSIEITDLTESYEEFKDTLEESLYSEKFLKEKDKKEKKKQKAEDKKSKNSTGRKSTVFVINFNGSTMAEEVETLRQEITAVLAVANKNDEVVVTLESPGGVVHGYGLAASQLDRIKQKGIKLTVCVDKVAASGGYLMSCVADKIVAAPFSIIGSIGVVMSMPNFNKVLKKNDIDYEQLTAGNFKRTLTVFGENTDEARDKLKLELEEIHGIFKDFILKYRPQVNLEKIATGEHWLATKAKDLDLVDEISTSDEYILSHIAKNKKVLGVCVKKKEKVAQKILKSLSLESENLLTRMFNKKTTPMA